jgi:hypothetical protein
MSGNNPGSSLSRYKRRSQEHTNDSLAATVVGVLLAFREPVANLALCHHLDYKQRYLLEGDKLPRIGNNVLGSLAAFGTFFWNDG